MDEIEELMGNLDLIGSFEGVKLDELGTNLYMWRGWGPNADKVRTLRTNLNNPESWRIKSKEYKI